MRGVSLLLTLAGGCLAAPTPAPLGDDAGPGDGGVMDADAPDAGDGEDSGPDFDEDVKAEIAELGYEIGGGSFTLDIGGSGLPTQFRINGTDMLTTASRSCPFEKGTGLALYPFEHYEDTRADGGGQAILLLNGPTVAIVETTWTRTFACAGDTAMFSGKTSFSVFRDGRVHRFDSVDVLPANSSPAIDGMCIQCGYNEVNDMDSMYLTSYQTFLDGTVIGATLAGGGGDTYIRDDQALCLQRAERAVSLGWWHTGGAAATGGNRRIVNLEPDGFSFVHDWLREANSVDQGNYQVQTTWIPRRTSTCELDRAGRIVSRDSTLRVTDSGGSVHTRSVGPSGMYDDGQQAKPFDVAAGNLELSTRSRIPRGWAIWFHLGGRKGPLTLTRVPPSSDADWYREQRDLATDSVILWFRDELTPGVTITVSSSPP